MVEIRINKYISDTGFCSRREADQLVLDERVTINGVLAQPGSRVKETDKVKIDGQILRPASDFSNAPRERRPKRKVVTAVEREEEAQPAERVRRSGTRGGARVQPATRRTDKSDVPSKRSSHTEKPDRRQAGDNSRKKTPRKDNRRR